MKGIGVKKLAAIGLGALLLGSAASAAFTSAELKNTAYTASGSPAVNVVVGSTAKISDVVWAGNIAQKLAQKAVTTGTCAATGEVSGATCNVSQLVAKLTVGGGTVSYSNAKTYDEYLNSTAQENNFDRNATISGGTITGTSLSKSQLPDLYDSTDTYKYVGSSATVTMKERILAVPNAKFSTASDIEALIAEITAGAFAYVVDLGTGIPATETAGTSTKFTDGTNDNIRIPWFGKKYLVKEVDANTSGSEYIRLVEDKGKQTFNVGDSFTVTGKGDYAGKTLTVSITQIVQTSSTGTYQATFVLKDGDTVLDTQTQGTGALDFTDSAGTDIMESTVDVDGIYSTAVGESTGYVEMYVGTTSTDLYTNNGYPYDAANATGIYNWKVTIYTKGVAGTSTNPLKVYAIKIYNSQKRWEDAGALKVGSEAEMAQGGFKVKFDGWKTDKSYTTVQIGNEVLTYKDTTGGAHTIPFIIRTTASDGIWESFSFDGKTYQMKIERTAGDANVHIRDADVVNGRTWTVDTNGSHAGILTAGYDFNSGGRGVAPGGTFTIDGVTYTVTGSYGANDNWFVTNTTGYAEIRKSTTTGDLIVGGADTNSGRQSYGKWFFTDNQTLDSNASFNPNLSTAVTIGLEGSNTKTYYYALRVNVTNNKAYLVLDGDQNFATEFSGNDKRIVFHGTDTAENWDINNQIPAFQGAGSTVVGGESYYIPDNADFGGSDADTTFYVGKFSVDEGGTGVGAADARDDVNVFISTKYGDGDLIVLPNTNLSSYGYQLDYNNQAIATSGLHLRSDTPASYYSEAYADSGTYLKVADGVATVKMPETRPYLQMTIKSAGTTETISGGEELTVNKGETGETTGGTKVTVNDVTYTATVTGGEGTTCVATPSTYKAVAPDTGKGKVYTDQSPPAGAKIIVGGPIVNRVAAQVTGLSAKLSKAGDAVAEITSTGDVIVAGYTAADTGTAAQELIDALDALN